MKTFNTFSLIFFVLLWVSCLPSGSVTTIYIENHSTQRVDSVVIGVDGHRCIMKDIFPNSTSSIKVSRDSIKSNNRFVIIIPEIHLRDTIIRGAAHYDDLSATFQSSYRFALSADLTLREVYK